MATPKERALYDLGYEWRMFRKLHALLESLPKEEDPVRDALVESLVLHGRNLIETFFGSNQGGDLRNALGIVPERMPPDVGKWYGAASTSIVHLPSDRPDIKPAWEFGVIGPQLQAKIFELRKNGTIGDNWEGDRSVDTKLLNMSKEAQAVLVDVPKTPISPTGAMQPAAVAAGPPAVPGVKGPTA